ncbi:trypsin-7 [Anabrus simplex]|uniref:trypsin-7 n=1 Tax=Anabrus simplex TaxID=316456 RepID=UPI0034DD8AC0
MRNESTQKKIGRIVGGHAGSISEHPYMVGFEKNGLLWCGGTIIGSDWIITAAHCFDSSVADCACIPTMECKIRAGTSKLEKEGFLLDVVTVHVHESYNEVLKNHAYDLAVVKVNKPFRDVSSTLIAANLPETDSDIPAGTMTTVMGWGKTAEKGDMASDLQEIQIPIVDISTCRNVYGRLIMPHMLCAGYPEGKIDACQADSGGPMIIDHTLVGLIAFGEGCARANRPGVYIKVASFRDWIKEKTGI